MTILLVPGYAADDTLWDNLRMPLAPFGPLVHADLRHDTSLAAIVAPVLRNAPPSLILVGHSMGAIWRAKSYTIQPERVEALAVIASSTRPDTDAIKQGKRAVARSAPSVSFAGLSRTAIATSLHPAGAGDDALIELVRQMNVRLGRLFA